MKLGVLGTVIVATILTGCGGASGSNSGSTGGAGEIEEVVDTNEVVETIEDVKKVYIDTTWAAGTDELLGLTYPQGAGNGPMILLKRTEDTEGDEIYRLMSADNDTREFSLVRALDTSNYYRDVVALPLVGTVGEVTIDDTLVITCGSNDAGYLDGADLVGSAQKMVDEIKLSAQSVAINPANPAQLEMYLVNDNTKTYTVSLETIGGAKIERCASLGGLSAVVEDGVVEITVLATGENAYNAQSSVVLNVVAEFELGTMTLPVTEITLDSSYSDSAGFVSAVAYYDSRNVGFLMIEDEGYMTADFIDFDSGDFLFLGDQSSNPFDSVGSWALDTVRDLVATNSNIYFVSEVAGLGAIDFGGNAEAVAVPVPADSSSDTTDNYDHCIDALAVNGATMWCHDSTDKGSLIQFAAPTIPTSVGSSDFMQVMKH